MDQAEHRNADAGKIKPSPLDRLFLYIGTYPPMLRLREIRARKGVSLRALKKASGVAVSSLAQFEAGRGDPQLSTLRKLAKALNVTVAKLIGERPIKKGG